MRLVVNEIAYDGPRPRECFCLGRVPDPLTGGTLPRFRPVEAGPHSFVLADKLAFCRFLYLEPAPPGAPPAMARTAGGPTGWPRWPLGVRIEMEPLDTNPARLHVTTVTAPLRVKRSPEIQYGDY